MVFSGHKHADINSFGDRSIFYRIILVGGLGKRILV